MRNATILVVKLKGVAAEAIKNIVLAGIGKLIIVDEDDVSAEDLGCNFLLRDEDVGKKVSESMKKLLQLVLVMMPRRRLTHSRGLASVWQPRLLA